MTDVMFGDPRDDSATVGATRAGINVAGGATLDVDDVLNTSGLAWNDSGGPDSDRTIQITLTDNKSDSTTLTVRPKPVILVHGLFSDASTWDAYVGGGGFLAGVSPLWRGYAVGDGQAPGVMDTSPFEDPGNTIQQNAEQEAMYITGIRNATEAAQVDVVAHSMGGLITRYYIQNLMPTQLPGNSAPVIAHLVMMGTPNEGSRCAYVALEALLTAAGLAPTSGASPNNEPLLQLTPSYLTEFNSLVTDRRGVPFSILAGNADHIALCTTGIPLSPVGEANDGVVTVSSAEWTIADRIVEPLWHTSMTGSAEAFTTYVKPHIALGPGATGGGVYTGPLVATAADLRRDAIARGSSAPMRQARPVSGRKTKLCLAPPPVPGLSAGGEQQVSPSKTASLAVSVPAHAGFISAVILAEPGVTTRLLDPSGHTVESIAANSSASLGLFRTLRAKNPKTGTWHIESATAGGSTEVTISVILGKPPTNVSLKLVRQTATGKLHLAARITTAGKPTRRARVALVLDAPGARAITITLRAVRHHAGSYVGQSTKPTLPATVLVRAKTRQGTSVTLRTIQNCA
jgi:pimeloyl-ACP methyl ester carboxylesterase